MSFTFFTFNSRFFWQDVYNFQGWVIQLNVRTLKFRLIDPFYVCRESGGFDQCKEKLLKYIEAYELEDTKKDTVIILHGFGKNKSSIKTIADSLKDINANIIPVGYATLRRGISFHSNILAQMIQNLETKGKVYIINTGASCLITRKLLSDSNNYRRYNIERILDINPLNSGSDLAQLLMGNDILNFILGPMLKDIATPNALSLSKLPNEIDHGIIFAPSMMYNYISKMLSRFESYPSVNPPSEKSYAEKLRYIKVNTLKTLSDETLIEACKNFITTGSFTEKYKPFSHPGSRTKRKEPTAQIRRVRKIRKKS